MPRVGPVPETLLTDAAEDGIEISLGNQENVVLWLDRSISGRETAHRLAQPEYASLVVLRLRHPQEALRTVERLIAAAREEQGARRCYPNSFIAFSTVWITPQASGMPTKPHARTR